ncbi:SDR family NAD(P)-dependent oxidoreductase [Palleronia caenipelagi]|uniref:SDR family NAD(P)-dependent oxidoreductase n=1 Tax=Palleronia caenipelagi TaxID=2489174 RepID=A0A547Q794_9RHOB|nr:SDR family NAD(P)-dependent oxidoreductase [Palleronia caenipelagi]TRD22260.1 SDR family NAD(P)-dependent oxidoreductase [Palleronia caenipelagi]
MREWQGKRYWIVGASEGLGRAVAEKVNRAGAEVVLSARSAERLQELADSLPGAAKVLPCDVSDADSVTEAAEAAGEIDGLIYLAGAYWPQSAREWNAEQVTAMLDVNLTGAARVLGQVVPKMVARDQGHIVLTGSLSGFRGLPNSIGYAASKAGLMALAEGMHADLRDTGVEVQLVNPGFIRTRLTDKNDFKMPQIMEPEDAAQQMFEHMSGDGFARNFPTAFGSAIRAMNFLPDALYYRLVS